MQSIVCVGSTDAPFCFHLAMFSASVFVMHAYKCEQISIQDIIHCTYMYIYTYVGSQSNAHLQYKSLYVHKCIHSSLTCGPVH